MRHEVYEDLDVKEDLSVFEFSSVGVNGIILKRIEFMATGLNDVLIWVLVISVQMEK
jgi:hypothetical protein